ncbi:hypothetical protein EBR11_03620 [bacterium]|nr:hypothetical protein [bacterium]
MRSVFLSLSALLIAASASGQTLFFKGNEKWEINDPFKLDNSIPPKPVRDPNKATINLVKGTVEKSSMQGGVAVVNTKKLSDVEKIVWPQFDRITDAQNFVTRGEPGKALDSIEPVLVFFDPLKKVPGNLWLKSALIKLDALDRLENDAATTKYLDTLERSEEASNPELNQKIKLARLTLRARKGDNDAVIKDATDLIAKSDDLDVLARLHLVKGDALLATKKYEAAMNTYLRVPVFYGSQTDHMPKALLGAARSFRGMDTPAAREQKLGEVSNRYLKNLISTYPLSKEAEIAKTMLTKEDRSEVEADETVKTPDGSPQPEPEKTPQTINH